MTELFGHSKLPITGKIFFFLSMNENLLGILETVIFKSGEGNGTLLQYSCLENPMDGGAW